jgi:hypothetical protein
MMVCYYRYLLWMSFILYLCRMFSRVRRSKGRSGVRAGSKVQVNVNRNGTYTAGHRNYIRKTLASLPSLSEKELHGWTTGRPIFPTTR